MKSDAAKSTGMNNVFRHTFSKLLFAFVLGNLQTCPSVDTFYTDTNGNTHTCMQTHRNTHSTHTHRDAHTHTISWYHLGKCYLQFDSEFQVSSLPADIDFRP